MAKTMNRTGAGLILGIGVGVAIGTALDNVAVGVGVGSAVGMALGALADRRDGGKRDRDEAEANAKP